MIGRTTNKKEKYIQSSGHSLEERDENDVGLAVQRREHVLDALPRPAARPGLQVHPLLATTCTRRKKRKVGEGEGGDLRNGN